VRNQNFKLSREADQGIPYFRASNAKYIPSSSLFPATTQMALQAVQNHSGHSELWLAAGTWFRECVWICCGADTRPLAVLFLVSSHHPSVNASHFSGPVLLLKQTQATKRISLFKQTLYTIISRSLRLQWTFEFHNMEFLEEPSNYLLLNEVHKKWPAQCFKKLEGPLPSSSVYFRASLMLQKTACKKLHNLKRLTVSY
jgi:hypothetical protein